MIPAGLSDDEVRERRSMSQRHKRLYGKKALKKVFIVKGKLVNIVIGD